LKYLTNIARQFAPFLQDTCIYSAHRVNVISFLGADLDRMVLDQLPMPYKISERSLNPDENFLVETLLEPNKPFVLLVRDYWPTGAWPENSLGIFNSRKTSNAPESKSFTPGQRLAQ
jgi:hypothetical protein